MADTTVKFFHSGMIGAPAVSAGAGAIAAILDACLINGFGLTAVSSLAIAANVATVITSTPHSLEPGGVALVGGVTGGAAAVNGEQKVLTTSTYSYTFATTGISNQTASGTITSKNASLGWSTVFTDTNLRVYRAPDGARFYMRLNDTGGAAIARVVGYESMSDLDTGVGPFPTSAMSGSADGFVWSKRAGSWFVAGDRQGFYLGIRDAGSTGHWLTYFGDMRPERSGDAYTSFCGGFPGDLSTQAGPVGGDLGAIAATPAYGGAVPRSSTGLGASQWGYQIGWPWPVAGLIFSGNGPFTYPDPSNNALRLSELKIVSNNSIRATLPGYYPCYQQAAPSYSHLDRVDGQGVLADRKIVACVSGSYSGATAGRGIYFFDITGPWAR